MTQAMTLRAGADVGRRDVDGRADQVEDLRDVAAGDALELAVGHLQRIARHAALGAAERNVDDGALPGHPGRQRLAVVEIDVRVVADAAFARAARVVVHDAVALEHPQVPVVHHDRHRDDDLAARVAQRLERVRVGMQDRGGAIDLFENVVERVAVNARRRARLEGGSDAAWRRRGAHCH